MIPTLILFGALLLVPRSVPTQSAPRLEFDVFDPDGQPARIDANELVSKWTSDDRVLFCVRCPEGERPDPRFQTPSSAGSTSPGRGNSVFFVEPGERYLYAYVGKDIAPIEGEITIQPNAPLTLRELHVEREVKTEMLRIQVARPDGSRLNHDFQVCVESLATGLTLFRSAKPREEATYGDRLPVGRYRVRVETEENAPGCVSGWRPKVAPFGDWVETIDLALGAPVEIVSTLWFSGKLRLALDVPRDIRPRDEVWRDRYPTQWEPPQIGWLGLGSHGPGARVTLRPDPEFTARPRERGMPEIEGLVVRFPIVTEFPNFQCDALLPGDEQTSAEWIPPGAYIVRVEAPDFAPIEAKVRIHCEDTTELRLKLKPR